MKKITLIICLISGYLFAQSWNDIVTTSIYEPNLVQIDNFANRDGIHVVVQNSNASNSIKYYRLNSSGTLQTSTTIETQRGAEFPCIAGDNGHLYISYRIGNYITTKKYIYENGTWEAQTSISLNNHDCDRVDNAYNDDGLHLVYSESDETHYYLYASSTPSNHKVVSDQNDDIGNYPTISLSGSKAHVGFNSYGYSKTRDKNLTNNTWDNTQDVVNYSVSERIQAGCDKLFDFYQVVIPGLIINLYVKERSVNGSTWSSPQLLNYSVNPYIEGMPTTTVTSDGQTHILYDSEQLIHRSYDCENSQWSDEFEVTSYSSPTKSSSISASSNDLFLVWKSLSGDYIKYRQYDAIPLAPTGLTITEDANNHPKLEWDANQEPDLNKYYIYRQDQYGGGWQYLAQTTNTYYTDATLTYCHPTPPATCENLRNFDFRVTAVDLNSHESEPSNEVAAKLVGGSPHKISVNPESKELREYKLAQNYPNPFNPTTTIDYSIKSSGLVTIKVFDMLGKEVTLLVNKIQEAGNYSVEFNASNLPSGIYVYRLTSGSFVATKKLILLR